MKRNRKAEIQRNAKHARVCGRLAVGKEEEIER